MTRRQPTLLDMVLNLVGQRKQAQQVGDMAAAFVKGFGQLFLGMAEPVHQLAE